MVSFLSLLCGGDYHPFFAVYSAGGVGGVGAVVVGGAW